METKSSERTGARTTRRPRGSVYTRPDCRHLWISYSVNGKKIRENSETDSWRKAEKLLALRLGEVTINGFTSMDAGRTTVAELLDAVITDYKINCKKSLDDAERRCLLHLLPFFGIYRAHAVSSDVVNRYVAARQTAGARNGSINRELSLLRRGFSLGMQAIPPKVVRAPRFARLQESAPRKGFMADQDFACLAAECAKEGLWLRAMLEVARSYGWRLAELQDLRVQQVDLLSRGIRLEPGSTKNGEGREVMMTDNVYTLLARCIQGKGSDDFVFTRHNGRRIADFRGTWHKVCRAANLGVMCCPTCDRPVAENLCQSCGVQWKQGQLRYRGLLWHDLRRTAVRNLLRSGITEKIAMTLTGHRTRSVFDRYAITAVSDLHEAAAKMMARDAAVAEKMRAVTQLSHDSVTVGPPRGDDAVN